MWYKPSEKMIFKNENEIRSFFPNSSLPAILNNDQLLELQIYPFLESAPPIVDNSIFDLIEGEPIWKNNIYQQTWKIIEKQVETNVARTDTPAASITSHFSEIITFEIQHRLDNFAQTKKYDNIITACSYIYSSNPIFSKEAKRCIDLRDAYWEKAIDVLHKIERGEISPRSFKDIECFFPELKW